MESSTNFLIQSSSDQTVKAGVSARRDEQNVGRVHLHRLAAQLPRRVSFRHIDDRALQHLQHALLHSFAAHVAQLMNAGHGSDLIDLIEENDSGLCSVDAGNAKRTLRNEGQKWRTRQTCNLHLAAVSQ